MNKGITLGEVFEGIIVLILDYVLGGILFLCLLGAIFWIPILGWLFISTTLWEEPYESPREQWRNALILLPFHIIWFVGITYIGIII